MKSNEGFENTQDKERRWLEEHKKFVAQGKFDAIPIEPISTGDVVAIRQNNIMQNVFEIKGDTATVGYDLEGQKIRMEVNINDIRSANGYQNAWFTFKNVGHVLRITTKKGADGKWISKSWNKTQDN